MMRDWTNICIVAGHEDTLAFSIADSSSVAMFFLPRHKQKAHQLPRVIR